MNYALINNNIVVNVIVADDEFIKSIESDYQHIEPLDTPEEQKVASPGWIWDPATNTFSDPVPPPPPPPIIEVWVIPSLMFRNRFTFQERVASTNAAKTDTTVAVFMEDLNANPTVNLQGEETVYAVNYLAEIGVIAADRVSVILAPVYQQDGQWVNPPTE